MKITYEYTPTDNGYKLSYNLTELVSDEDGKYNSKEVREMFKAILMDIIDNHEITLPLSGLIKYIDKSTL